MPVSAIIAFCFGHATLWDISSCIRDQTHPPAWEAQNLNHWTTREVPLLLLLKSLLLSPLTKGRSGAWKKNGFSSLPVF